MKINLEKKIVRKEEKPEKSTISNPERYEKYQ
jgi:hypothetical protein